MQSFREVLKRAKQGDSDAMNMLMLVCKDALEAGCRVNGKPDEELRALIYFRFVQAVQRFRF